MEMNIRAIEFFSSENMVKSASKGLRQHDDADSCDGLQASYLGGWPCWLAWIGSRKAKRVEGLLWLQSRVRKQLED